MPIFSDENWILGITAGSKRAEEVVEKDLIDEKAKPAVSYLIVLA